MVSIANYPTVTEVYAHLFKDLNPMLHMNCSRSDLEVLFKKFVVTDLISSDLQLLNELIIRQVDFGVCQNSSAF